MPRSGPRKVYVSSPYLGLEREREAVVEAVRRLEHLPVHMERYGADVRPVLEKIRADVRDSDAYVLILGWRYGEVVEGRSFTHWEYEAARSFRKPTFLYLTPERGARPALPSDDPPGSAVDAWRARLRADQAQRGATAFVFRDFLELEKQVLADLGRWLGGDLPRVGRAQTARPEGMVQLGAGALPAFWIDRCAVSNADFARFLVASGYQPDVAKGFLEHWRGGEPPAALRRHPVVCVSWDDAASYARWAGKDLPTQAEWERAALGEERRPFPWGTTFEAPRCNSFEAGRGTTLPVDALPDGASSEGCLGLAGNVHEWTATWFEPEHPRTRVVCGGSWATRLASTGLHRHENRMPGDRDHRTGFRCVWRPGTSEASL